MEATMDTTKKTYRCGICLTKGHNARTCPALDPDDASARPAFVMPEAVTVAKETK